MTALHEFRWVGVKVSPHGHAVDGVWAESDRDSEKDTGRYLRAGAEQAYLIADLAGGSVATLLRGLRTGGNGSSLLVESNRVEPRLVAVGSEPVLTLAVLAEPVAEWKSSLRELVGSADALVLTCGLEPDRLPLEVRDTSAFRLEGGSWVSPELVAFVRAYLVG